MTRFVIIGNPENRRITMFAAEVNKLTGQAPLIFSYADLLENKCALNIPEGSILRLESPGENNVVREKLIAKGSGNHTHLPHGIIAGLQNWYAGYSLLLNEIENNIHHMVLFRMNNTAEIQVMFDKIACQQILAQHGIPVARSLGDIQYFDELVTQMRLNNCLKVFIKPAHGSSASGVIAFRMGGNKMQAISSAILEETNKTVELYNSLRVKTYTKPGEIAVLINAVLQQRAIIEEWIPKAVLEDHYFDLRVLVINKKARHIVLRTSNHVITNLHLGNKRGDIEKFVARFGQKKLDEVKALAESVAAVFYKSFYFGVDILLSSDTKRLVVLEVNAFGDLLPGLLDQNENCYEAEIKEMLRTGNAVLPETSLH